MYDLNKNRFYQRMLFDSRMVVNENHSKSIMTDQMRNKLAEYLVKLKAKFDKTPFGMDQISIELFCFTEEELGEFLRDRDFRNDCKRRSV